MHGHTHAGPESRNMTYFQIPGPLKTTTKKRGLRDEARQLTLLSVRYKKLVSFQCT